MLTEFPDATTREGLLDVLGELVAKGGPGRLLAAPVEPGVTAFPEPWAPSKAGIELLLRRLAWHAGLDRAIEINDERAGAPPTQRKPMTSVELIEVRPRAAVLALHFIGEDDVAGTLAHEIGVAYAALHRPQRDPYRSPDQAVVVVDPEVDLERGSIAAVYLGLGTLAANAARQQHTVLERQGYHPLLVASSSATVEAGHLPMESLAYLLAVQAVVRGAPRPPTGLQPEQRRAVEAWIAELHHRGAELRAHLGIAADAEPQPRPPVVPFEDGEVGAEDAPRATAFRWRTHRAGLGTIAGAILGVGLELTADFASGGAAVAIILGSAVGGHLIGRRIPVPRCSKCATVLGKEASTCPRCGATLRGDISSLSERLDAEERLSS